MQLVYHNMPSIFLLLVCWLWSNKMFCGSNVFLFPQFFFNQDYHATVAGALVRLRVSAGQCHWGRWQYCEAGLPLRCIWLPQMALLDSQPCCY